MFQNRSGLVDLEWLDRGADLGLDGKFVMVVSVRAEERGAGVGWASTASGWLGTMFASRWADRTPDVKTGPEAGVVEAPGLDGDGDGDDDESKKVSQDAGSCSETTDWL